MADQLNSKRDLRAAMRIQRRGLSDLQREDAGRRVLRLIRKHGLLAARRRVAVYLAWDGELDTAAIIHHAWRMGVRLFLPVVPRPSQRRLRFAPFYPDSHLVPDRYGIPMPQCHPSELHSARCLDTVLLPLVSFDRRGTRLGMGAGHYDATFDFLQQRQRWRQPRLIGLGYAFQETSEIQRDRWDVSMHAIVTEKAMIPVPPPRERARGRGRQV